MGAVTKTKFFVAFTILQIGTSFKAAWIPSSYQASTEDALCQQMISLQEIGIDRVYLDVWNQGSVYFNSPTMKAVVPSSVKDDRLTWALSCTGFDGAVVAWFEYGLIAAYGSLGSNDFATYAQAQGWVLGEEGSFFWLNASQVDALDFLANLVGDACALYGETSATTNTSKSLSGVQLDDHFAQPVSLVGVAVNSFTEAAESFSRTVRARAASASSSGSSPVFLSLSPTTLSQALGSFNVDWKAWGEYPAATPEQVHGAAGSSGFGSGDSKAYPLFDEFVPQLYRASFADFAELLNTTLAALGPDWGLPPSTSHAPGTTIAPQGDGVAASAAAAAALLHEHRDHEGTTAVSSAPGVVLGVGVRIDGSGDATAWDDLEAMLDDLGESAQKIGRADLPPSLWYSHGVLELYPTELASYWSSQD